MARGVAGEPLRAVPCGRIVAVVGEVGALPAITVERLAAHDAVVRAVFAAADAMLPARFGTLVADKAALAAALAPRAAWLEAALAEVAGREQMTLRVLAPDGAERAARPPAGAGVAPGSESPGVGARYLEARRRRHEPPAALAPLRAVLAPLVAAERVSADDRPPIVASLYHLVARGTAAEYAAAVERAAPLVAPLHVTVTGPWAPYAFAEPPA
jgi:hypothetical protein